MSMTVLSFLGEVFWAAGNYLDMTTLMESSTAPLSPSPMLQIFILLSLRPLVFLPRIFTCALFWPLKFQLATVFLVLTERKKSELLSADGVGLCSSASIDLHPRYTQILSFSFIQTRNFETIAHPRLRAIFPCPLYFFVRLRIVLIEGLFHSLCVPAKFFLTCGLEH